MHQWFLYFHQNWRISAWNSCSLVLPILEYCCLNQFGNPCQFTFIGSNEWYHNLASPNSVRQNLWTLTLLTKCCTFIQPFVQNRCPFASLLGLPGNSGIKFDQVNCTNCWPCGACGTCGACGACGVCGITGACGACGAWGAWGTTGPAGVEGLQHLLPDLPFLTYAITNLSFNYYSSITVLFYSSCATLLPCFYFLFLTLFFILVMFIYSLFLLLTLHFCYNLLHYNLFSSIFSFLSFSKLNFICLNSYLIPDLINNFSDLSYLKSKLIPDDWFKPIEDLGNSSLFQFSTHSRWWNKIHKCLWISSVLILTSIKETLIYFSTHPRWEKFYFTL